MKRLFMAPLFFMILLAGSLHGQERRRVSMHMTDDNKEVYFVLAANENIKDGPYQLFRKHKLITSGYYKNGQKDSSWEVYNPASAVLLACKFYADGKKTGSWEFFTITGEAEWSYDFNSGVASCQKPAGDANSYYQTDAGEWLRDSSDHSLLALRGVGEWFAFLIRNLRYPDEAMANEQQGS